jgi:hypothetical protein
MVRLTDDHDTRGDIARLAMFHFKPGFRAYLPNDTNSAYSLLAAATALQ